MSDAQHTAESGSPTEAEPALGRRHLLRGGAVLAGAAGAVALTAVARPAYAADGQPVLQGSTNEAQSTTSLRIGSAAGSEDPTLSLANAAGASLELQPIAPEEIGALAVGQIANTEVGPSIGVVDPDGYDTVSFLATEFDLIALPEILPISPQRIVDTRFAADRVNIIPAPAGTFDAAGRLVAGKAMSLSLGPADGDVTIDAAFVNLVSVGSLAGGYLTVYVPGPRPTASTLNFAKGQTIANGAFVGIGVVADQFAFTVYANQTTHVIVDLSGTVLQQAAGPASGARSKAPGYRRPRAARRTLKLFGKPR